MEEIKSNATKVSARSETETEVKMEVKEEFCTAADDINSEEITSNIQSITFAETYEVQRPERSSQYYEVMLPSIYGKRLPLRCRLCATQGIDMVDMLDPNESDKNILEKIEHCLPIVVKETDLLPKHACRLCLANLELCYQFHKTVAEAERQFLAVDKLASRQVEETEGNRKTFQPPNDRRSVREHDHFEAPLKKNSDLDTNKDEWTSIREEVRTNDTPVTSATSNIVSASLKPHSELFFPAKTLDKDNRIISSSDNVYQNADSPRNMFDSWRTPVPQNTQQSTYDSLVYPDMSNRSLVHRDMLPSSFYGIDFPHLRTTKENLALHDPAQIRKGPYSCRVCAKTFRSKTGRDNHVRTHTGEGLHSCKYCDKKFSLKGNRDYHHRIHTGERPFKCSICNKTFAWLSSLYEHASVHSKDRNHHCPVCNKSFKLLRARNRHMASHTGEQAVQL